MTAVRTALIIGGGIAGPAAAMALQKAGIEATVYEAYQRGAVGVGGGLGIAPNGRNALCAIGAGHVVDEGLPMPCIAMYSGTGRRLTAIRESPDLPPTQAVSRADLYRKIYDEAVGRGIRIEHGKRLVAAEDTDADVTAHFADGSQACADILIGADGIHSTVRPLLDPNAPQPTYTGLVSFGGWITGSRLPSTGDECRMVFGRHVFSGYQVTDDGRGFWYINMPSEQRVSIQEMRARPAGQWLRELQGKVADDSSPMDEILREFNPADLMITGASEYMPHVPTWHRGQMMLIGDSAHAPSSSSGQGASLALEDAVQLARCLRDLPTPADAFTAFEALRRPRVAKIIAEAERNNTRKTARGASRLLRDLLLPALMKLFANPEQSAWKYAYYIDWDAPVTSEIAAATS